MKKTQSIILFSIIFTLITLSTTIAVFAEKSNTTPLEINPNYIIRGTPAMQWTLEDILSDTTFSFESLSGKVVVLDFTISVSFEYSIPELINAKAKYSADDLEIISVVLDLNDSEEEIEQFAADNDMDWKIIRDTIGIASFYELLGFPTFYVIDQEQIVYQAILGDDNFDELDGFILELLPEYSSSPNPTNNGGPFPEFWAKNWYWFLLGGVMFVVVTGLMVQRRRIVLHNRKVREQKTEARQRRVRKKER